LMRIGFARHKTVATSHAPLVVDADEEEDADEDVGEEADADEEGEEGVVVDIDSLTWNRTT